MVAVHARADDEAVEQVLVIKRPPAPAVARYLPDQRTLPFNVTIDGDNLGRLGGKVEDVLEVAPGSGCRTRPWGELNGQGDHYHDHHRHGNSHRQPLPPGHRAAPLEAAPAPATNATEDVQPAGSDVAMELLYIVVEACALETPALRAIRPQSSGRRAPLGQADARGRAY